MSYNRGFYMGQRLRWRGRECIVEKRLGNQHIELKDVLLATSSSVPEMTLVDGLFQGDTEVLDQSTGLPASDKLSKRILAVNFAELPARARARAKRRLAYVKAYLASNSSTMSPDALAPIIAAAAAEIGDDKPPSGISVYRWKRKYLNSGGNIRSLADDDMAKGNRCSRLQPEVKSIVETTVREVYLTIRREPGSVVCTEVETRISRENRRRKKLNTSNPDAEPLDLLIQPSRGVVYSFIRQLDPDKCDQARLGERLAKLKYHANRPGPRPERPLERVELDHTSLRVMILDTERWLPIGRPYLTLAYDKLTACPQGFHVGFEPPSYVSVAKCLRHAIAPKTYVRQTYPNVKHEWKMYGVPEVAFCDNGADFHSNDLEDACDQIGTHLEYAPAKHPWWKASIERHFRTLKSGLINQQPGADFAKLFEKLDYNPSKDAVLSMDNLLEILHIWLIDIYLETPQRGSKLTPAAAWDRAVEKFPPTLPTSPRDLDIFMYKHEERRLRSRGVEYKGLLYNSEELMLIRKTLKSLPNRPKVKVKIDPDDLSCVYVLDSKNLIYVPALALCQSYTKGLSLWHHDIIRRHARQDHEGVLNIDDLCEARDRIHSVVKKEWEAGGSRKKGKTVHRWLESASLEISADPRVVPPGSEIAGPEGGVMRLDHTNGWTQVSAFSSALSPALGPAIGSETPPAGAGSKVSTADGTEQIERVLDPARESQIKSEQIKAKQIDCSGWETSRRSSSNRGVDRSL